MDRLLEIRRAASGDLPSLQGLYAYLHPHDLHCPTEEAEAILRTFLLYPGSAIMVGTFDRQLVATCALVVVPNLTRGGKPYGLIENVVTRADYRTRGFASAVLAAALQEAWRHACYKVMLMTGSKRPETLAFYRKAGFEQSKTAFQVRNPSA
jgi:GNAT superfamily N-acetyltransferase